MPHVLGAFPHFNRFTAVCVSTNEGGPQLLGGSAIGIEISPDIHLDIWWMSLVQLLNVTGPAGLHFVLLCQEPTTLYYNCSTLRDGLG